MDSANDENFKVHFFPHLQSKRRRKLTPVEGQYSSSPNLGRMMKENHQTISKKGKSNEKSQPRTQKTVYSDSNHLPVPDTTHPEDSMTRNQLIYSESDMAVSLGREPESNPQNLDQFVPDTFYDNYYGQPRGSYPYPQDYLPTSLRVYPEQPMTSTPFPRNSFEMLKRNHYGSGTIYPFQHPQTSSTVKHQSLYRHPGVPEPPVHYYNYTQYEPPRKNQDYEHGFKYQNPDPDINFDPQRRSYQYPKLDGDQIYDYCERGHPYYARGMRGWPYHQRTEGKPYAHIRTDDKINPSADVQRSQPFTSTLDHMKVEDGLSCITDNFTELELLRGDDLGVIKIQPFQHPSNIPRLDAGHERFWDSPMTMMAPDSGFDPDMDDCHLRYNREIYMPEMPKSRIHCMTNFQYPTKGPLKGTAPQTVTCKSMENTELNKPHPLDKKMLKTHQKLTDLNQKHCTENRVHNHQLRCLDKVAQWISTLDVMPTLSSTTSGIDMEHFDAIESPEVTPDHISAEPKVLNNPEPQCHMTTLIDTNDKMERDLADDEEQGKEPGPQCCHKMLTDINDKMETDVADGQEKGRESDIQCHDLSTPNTNDKTEAEVADAEGDGRGREAIPEVNISQIYTITDSQSDPGTHLEITVKENVLPTEEDATPQTEKLEELPSENKETEQNEPSTATSDVSGPEPRNYPEEIDDAETSIFEELNFIYYQGETTSHTASNESSCGNQPDTDFILKALDSPWKETGVSLPPPQSTPSQQESHPLESNIDDVCSSSKSPSKAVLLYPDDSISKKGSVEFQAAETSVGSSQPENPLDDSVTALSCDALFEDNHSDDWTEKGACSSIKSKSNTPPSVPASCEQENHPDNRILEKRCSTATFEPTTTPSNALCLQSDLQDDLSHKDVGSSTKSKPYDSHHQEACSSIESQDITMKANQEMDLSTIGSDASTLSTLHYSGVTTESLVQATYNADMIDIEAVETSCDKTLTLNAEEHMENKHGDVSTLCEPFKSVEASSLRLHSGTSSTTFMAETHVEALESMPVSLHPESVKTHIHDSLDNLNTMDILGKKTSTPDENLPDSQGRTGRPELPEKKKSTLRRKKWRKSSAARKPAYSRNRSKLGSYRNQKHQKKDGRRRILMRGKSSYNLRKIENSVHIELDTGFNWTAEISESPHKDNILENINQSYNSGITLALSPKLMLNISKENLTTDKKNDLEPNTDAKCDAPNSSGKQKQLNVNPRNLRSRSRSASNTNTNQNDKEWQQSSKGAIERAESGSSSKGMIISVQRKTAEQIQNDSISKVKCNKTSPKNLRKRNSKASDSKTSVPFHSVATSSTSNDLKDKDSIGLPTCNVKPILKTVERSRVTYKQRSKAKLAVKTTKPRSVAFMTSFNPNEDNLKGNRSKKVCSAERGIRSQATKESSLKASSVKPASKANSKKIFKAEPKKITQKTPNLRSTSGKMQPWININEKNMLGASKEDMVIPCSIDVKYFKITESKTKKRKAMGSNNLDDNVPKQRKVSKTSNMSQRFVARPWRSPSTSEINAEKSRQTNLLEGLQTVADHVHSGKCSKNTGSNLPATRSSTKSEERSSQRCANRKIEHGSKRITKQAQFPDSKLVPVKPKKTSTIRNKSAPKDTGGISKKGTDKSTSLKKSSKMSDQSASNIQTRRRLQTLYSPSVVLNGEEQVNSSHPENTRIEPSKNIPEVACGAKSKVQKNQILDSAVSKSKDVDEPSCVEVTNKLDCHYDKDNSEPQKSSLSVNICQEARPNSPLQSFVGDQVIEKKSVTFSCPVNETHPKTMVDFEGDVETRSILELQPNVATVETESTSNKSKVVKRGRPPPRAPKKETVDNPKKKTKTSCHMTKAKGIKDDFTSPDNGSQTSNFQTNPPISENASSGSLPINDTGNQSVNHAENLVQDRQQDTSSLQVNSTNLEKENKQINGDMETTSFEVFQSLKALTEVEKFNKCPPPERAGLLSKSAVRRQTLISFANGDRLIHLKKLLGDYSSTFRLKTSKNYAVEKQKLKNVLPSRMLSRIPSTKLSQKMLPQIQRNLQRNFNLEFKRSPLLEQTYHTSRYFNKLSQPNHIPYKLSPIIHKKHQNNVMQTITVPDPQNGVWVSRARVPDLFNEPLTEMFVNDNFCYSDMDNLSILSEDLAGYDGTSTSGLLTDVLFGQSADIDRPEPSDGSIKEKMDDLRLQIDIGEMLFSTQLNYDNGLDFESILDIEDDDHSADKDSPLDLIMNSIEMYDAVQDSSILSSNEDPNFRQVTAPLDNPGSDNITFSKESTNNVKHSHDASSVQLACSSGASSPSSYGYHEQNPEIVTSIQQRFQTLIDIDEKPKQLDQPSKEALESNPSHPDIGLAWKNHDRPAVGNIPVSVEETIHKPTDSLSIQKSFRKVGLFLEMDHPCEFDLDDSKDIKRVTENGSDDDSCLYSDDADLPIDGQITHTQSQLIIHDPQNLPSRKICLDMNPKGSSDMEEIFTTIADTKLFDPFGVKSFVHEYQRTFPVEQETLPNSVQNPPAPEEETEQSVPMVITSYEDTSPMQGESSMCLEVDPSSPHKCNAKEQTCESYNDLTISSIVEKVRKSKAERKRSRGKCTLNIINTNTKFGGATVSASKSKKLKSRKNVDSSTRRRTTKSLSNSVQRSNKRRRRTIAAIEDSTSNQTLVKSEKMKTGPEPVSHKRMSAKANTRVERSRSSSSVSKTPKSLISKSNQESSSKSRTVNTKQKRSKSLGNSSDHMKPFQYSFKTEKASDSRKRKRARSSSPIPRIKAATGSIKGTKRKRTKSCGAKAETPISSTPADSTIGKGKKSTKLTKVESRTRSTRIKQDRSDDIQDDLNSDSSTEPDDSDKRQSLYKVECRFCQELFAEEDALRNHSKLQHDTEEVWKNVICGYCSKVFGRKYRYHRHLMTEHSSEDWERHPCPYCQKEFPASYRLKRHIHEHMSQEHMPLEHMPQEHMPEDEHKPKDEHMPEDEYMLEDNVSSYKCLLCSTMLSKSDSDLRHHFKRKHEEFHDKLMKQYHSNEDVEEELEIFVCRYCGVFGLSLLEFKQHVIDSHNSYLAQFETDVVKDRFVSEILEMDKLAIFSESCYLCIYCSKKIDSVEDANDHITGNHSQMMQNPLDDQYLCAFCNFSAETPYKIKKHIGKNHWFIESLMANSAIMYFKPEKSD